MDINTDRLAVVAVFRAQPGKHEELGRQLLSLVEPTRKEAGSLLYHICQSEQDADEWIVIENWRGRQSFDFHMSTPYVRAFMDQVPQLCAQDPDIRFQAIRSPAYEGKES